MDHCVQTIPLRSRGLYTILQKHSYTRSHNLVLYSVVQKNFACYSIPVKILHMSIKFTIHIHYMIVANIRFPTRTIPPETKINHSIIKELDDTYRYHDSQLSAILKKVDSLVDRINETAEDSLSLYLTYTALALPVLNSVAMIIACKKLVSTWCGQLTSSYFTCLCKRAFFSTCPFV